MDSKIFYQGMAKVMLNFNVSFSRGSLMVWEMDLNDVSNEDFMAAVITICRRDTKPDGYNWAAIFRKEIDLMHGDAAEEAWGHAVKEIQKTGIYGKPKFENPVIAEAVRAIGWQTLCNTREGDMGTMRAHFYRTYDAFRKRAQFNETTKLLESAAMQKILASVGKELLPE
jgi:hypothetical protein